MATNRDVKLTLSVATLGESGINALQQAILKLASEGGTAAPKFQKLADEVGRLGEQSASLQSFRTLAEATDLLATKQVEAANKSTALAEKLANLKTVTEAAKLKQQEAAAEYVKGQKAVIDAGAALSTYTKEQDTASKKTDDVKAKTAALIAEQATARKSLLDLREAQRSANAELAAAEAAQKKVEQQYTRSEAAAKSVTTSLNAQNAALTEAAEAARKLGVSTTDVATAEGLLLTALNKAGTEADKADAEIRQLAEAEKTLAAAALAAEAAEKKRSSALQATYNHQLAMEASIRKLNASLAASETERETQRLKGLAAAEAIATEKEKERANALQATYNHQLALEASIRKLNASLVASETERETNRLKGLAAAAEIAAAKEKALTDAATLAAKQLQGAFNALNVRSFDQINADIAKVRNSLDVMRAQSLATGSTLAGAFNSGQAKLLELERELRSLNGTLTTSDKLAGVLKNSMGQITAGNIIADGVGYLVQKVKQLGSAFIESIVAGDQLRRGLTAVYKDAGIAAKQIDFLKLSSSESGVAFSSLEKDFVRFSASMRSAKIPLEDSNRLFRAVTAASAALGLDATATAGTLNALGQMASKGTVSMEELRQQLGDRLPGAIGLAAKGFGITEAQLVALVSSGQLATRDFLVPFTRALEEMGGETEGLIPTWERLKGLFANISQSLGDAGFIVIFTGALKILGGTVSAVALGLSVLVEGIFLVGSGVTALVAKLSGSSDAWGFFNKQVEKSTERLTSQARMFNTMLDPIGAVTEAVGGHTGALTANTAATVTSINTNAQLTGAHKLTALSAKLNADATLDAGAKIVQYNVAATEMRKVQEVQVEAMGKLAKAAKEEGDTMIMLAKATGDEGQVRDASIKAAELHRNALNNLAREQSVELDMLVAQRAELVANAEKREGGTLAVKTQIDALDNLIKTARAETEQSRQGALAAEQELFNRKLQIKLLDDHSGQVDKLKAAVVTATDALSTYEVMAKNGQKTETDVLQKRKELAEATALYRDALNDAITASKLNAKALEAELAIDKDLLSEKITHNNLLIKEAALKGDLIAVGKLEREGKQLVIDQMKLEIIARANAYDATLKQNKIARQLIDSTTDLGKQQIAALDIEKALIESKASLNLAGLDAVTGLEKELQASKNAADGVMSLVDAYKQLGLKTPQELEKVAASNKAAWQAIKDDSKSSVTTLVSAFEAYAKSAIEAADSISPAQRKTTEEVLKTEASAKKLSISFDDTGKAIVKAMGTGGEAIKGATGYMDVFQRAAKEATAALEKQNAELERTLSVEEKALDLKQRAIDLQNRKNNVDREGFTLDKDGNRLVMSSETPRSVYEKAKSQGLTEAQALQIMNEFMRNGQQSGWYGEGAREGKNWYTALQAAIDKLVLQNAANAANVKPPASDTGSTAAKPPVSDNGSSTSGVSSSTKTVNVVINGRSQSVTVASDADANALTSIIRALETAANTSS